MTEKTGEQFAPKKETSPSYNAPLIYKAFALIEEVAEKQAEQGISDLARGLNISKSTIFGITQALTDLGVLIQDPVTKKFSLGPTLVKLGNKALAGADLRAIARPYIIDLSLKYRETVFLGTFDENGITIIDKADSPEGLKITAPVGSRIPRYAGATGKVFLSSMRESVLKKLMEKPIPKFTQNTITDTVEYLEVLQLARERGYATDFEEYMRGVNAISVPLMRGPWSPVGAIWMVGFSHSFIGEKLEMAVAETIQTAKQISKLLGN